MYRSNSGQKVLIGILAIAACILDIFVMIMIIVNMSSGAGSFVSGFVFGYILWFLSLGLGIISEVMAIMQIYGSSQTGIGNQFRIITGTALGFRICMFLWFFVGWIIIVIEVSGPNYHLVNPPIFWVVTVLVMIDMAVFCSFAVVHLMFYPGIQESIRSRGGGYQTHQNYNSGGYVPPTQYASTPAYQQPPPPNQPYVV